MATTYEKADDEVLHVLDQMLLRYHRDLVDAGVTFDVLIASNPDKSPLSRNGVPAAAQVCVMPLKYRVKGSADVEICIDGKEWERYSPAMRAALLDHELEHLELTGETDDIDRPKMKLRGHNWELWGFRTIVARHGPDSIDARNVVGFLSSEDGREILRSAGLVLRSEGAA